MKTISSSSGPIGVEYSSMSAFNCDSTRLLLLHSARPNVLDHFALYDGDGNYVRDLPIGASAEPRWSRTEPNIFYHVTGNVLKRHDCGDDTDIILKIFFDYASINGSGESEISPDGNHMVLAGRKSDGGTDIFVYSIKAGAVEAILKDVQPFDGLKITSTNQVIYSDNQGIWLLSRDMLTKTRLTTANGHACLAGDSLIWTNSNENPITLPDFPNGIVKIDIASGRQTGLLSPLSWMDAVHITAPERGDFCLVATYGSGEPAGKIYRVMLDGSGHEVIADNINANVINYEDSPKISVSRDGTRYVYTWKGNVYLGMLNNSPVVEDRVVQAVCADLRQRSAVGLKKYGVSLERKDLTLDQWLEHAYTEALDMANYLKRSIMEMRGEL